MSAEKPRASCRYSCGGRVSAWFNLDLCLSRRRVEAWLGRAHRDKEHEAVVDPTLRGRREENEVDCAVPKQSRRQDWDRGEEPLNQAKRGKAGESKS